MKKYFLVFLVLLIVLSFAGCNTAEFAVGAKEDVAYFRGVRNAPEIILKDYKNTRIEEKPFLDKLAAAVDGKEVIYSTCNCRPTYHVSIGQYTFGLHTHSIDVLSSEGNDSDAFLFSVMCSEEEMQELFDILEAAGYKRPAGTE